jgi:hypothetical protein
MKLGSIYMIQRLQNNPRNGDSGFPLPEKFKTQKSSSKVLASVFWDIDGILHVGYLETGKLQFMSWSIYGNPCCPLHKNIHLRKY